MGLGVVRRRRAGAPVAVGHRLDGRRSVSQPDILSAICRCPADVRRPSPGLGPIVLVVLAPDGLDDVAVGPHLSVAAAVLWARRHGVEHYRVLPVQPPDDPPPDGGALARVHGP